MNIQVCQNRFRSVTWVTSKKNWFFKYRSNWI